MKITMITMITIIKAAQWGRGGFVTNIACGVFAEKEKNIKIFDLLFPKT